MSKEFVLRLQAAHSDASGDDDAKMQHGESFRMLLECFMGLYSVNRDLAICENFCYFMQRWGSLVCATCQAELWDYLQPAEKNLLKQYLNAGLNDWLPRVVAWIWNYRLNAERRYTCVPLASGSARTYLYPDAEGYCYHELLYQTRVASLQPTVKRTHYNMQHDFSGDFEAVPTAWDDFPPCLKQIRQSCVTEHRHPHDPERNTVLAALRRLPNERLMEIALELDVGVEPGKGKMFKKTKAFINPNSLHPRSVATIGCKKLHAENYVYHICPYAQMPLIDAISTCHGIGTTLAATLLEREPQSITPYRRYKFTVRKLKKEQEFGE